MGSIFYLQLDKMQNPYYFQEEQTTWISVEPERNFFLSFFFFFAKEEFTYFQNKQRHVALDI